MTAYWKTWAALGAGLLVLALASFVFPDHPAVLVVAAVQTVVAALAVLMAPQNRKGHPHE